MSGLGSFAIHVYILWRSPQSPTILKKVNRYFTNRFHVVMRLFSNRSQITSKCGKNKKVAHEATANKLLHIKLLFISKYFNITRRAGLGPLWRRWKNPFDVIYYLYKMKQFHWLLCVAKNCDWSRKIAPLSNLTRASLLVEWKLTAKGELSCELYKS